MDVEQTIRGYLPQIVHMSLGTSKDNKPWVCEVHFAYDDHLNLYFRSLPTRRHSQEIAANPHIAGNIVKQHALGEPHVGVYFEGAAEMLQPGAEQQKAFECMKERLHTSDDALADSQQPNSAQFYKITVETFYLFGRFNTEHGQKYELKWQGGQK